MALTNKKTWLVVHRGIESRLEEMGEGQGTEALSGIGTAFNNMDILGYGQGNSGDDFLGGGGGDDPAFIQGWGTGWGEGSGDEEGGGDAQ